MRPPTLPSGHSSARLAAMMNYSGFLSETPPLLCPGVDFDPVAAYDWVTREVLPLIPSFHVIPIFLQIACDEG